MNIEQVARILHETNRAYCESIGDTSQTPWKDTEQWQRDAAVSGVEFMIANPAASPLALHEAWVANKTAGGWVYGEVKDSAAKTHPCLVPYEQLPVEQRVKDHLFVAVVGAFQRAELDGAGMGHV